MKKAIIRGVILVELAAVLGTFRVWRSMNSSQEYRKWMHDTYPTILEGYYKTADATGYGDVRAEDFKKWDK